eukprot:226266_1
MWSCHKNRISTKKATWNIAALIELSHHSLSDVLSAGYAQSVLTEFIHSLGVPYWLFSLLLYMNGFVLWTFLEYWQPSNHRYDVVLFIVHVMHHLIPVDKYRLVFPPAVSLRQ